MTVKLKLMQICVLILGVGLAGNVSAAAPLEAQRDAAFQDMLADPSDMSKMLAYAKLSVAVRDYEAAAATLERVLDQSPGNLQARYELAVAYYALGSYELAQHHLNVLRNSGALSAEQSQAVAAYQTEADKRQSGSSVRGYAAAGLSYSDDADGITAAGSFALRWSTDMRRANANHWVTEVQGGLYSFAGSSDLDSSRLLVRTGPMFSLDGLAYGTHVRPYIEGQASWDGDSEDRGWISAGVQVLHAHSALFSSFADIEGGHVFGMQGGSDGEFLRGALGVTYTPSRETRLRFALRAREDRFGRGSSLVRVALVAPGTGGTVTTTSELSSARSWGARLDLSHEFRAKIAGGRRMRASAFAQYDVIDYFRDPAGREDKVTAVGASLRTYLNKDLFIEAGARAVHLNSSDNSLDKTTPMVSLLVGVEF